MEITFRRKDVSLAGRQRETLRVYFDRYFLHKRVTGSRPGRSVRVAKRKCAERLVAYSPTGGPPDSWDGGRWATVGTKGSEGQGKRLATELVVRVY